MIRTHMVPHLVTFFAGALAGAIGLYQFVRPDLPTRSAHAMSMQPVIRAVTSRDASERDPNVDQRAVLSRPLALPIAGAKLSDIRDTFRESRANGKAHEATDIAAPRDTPVLALGDGTVRKLFLSKPGGITIYEFDPDDIYCYYYAHLDHYAAGLHEGMSVKRGDVIGYVGTTGNARSGVPHLHFAIVKLGPDKHWWQGEYIDPYPILRDLARRR